MIYGDLTSPDLARVAPETIAVLPIAAVEQHGPHLPVVTDSAIAAELGRRLEALLPEKVVLLPVLPYGCSHHHTGFPGTMSLRSELYIEVLVDLIESLIGTGFRRIYLLNCHGGNQIPFAEALYRINIKHRGPNEPIVAAASYWNLAAPELSAQTFMESQQLTHACEYETSMMLALRSDWVKAEGSGQAAGIGSDYYDPLGYLPGRVTVTQSFDQMTQNGAMGNPELATAEKGEKLFELIAASLAEFIEEFSRWKRQPHGGIQVQE